MTFSCRYKDHRDTWWRITATYLGETEHEGAGDFYTLWQGDVVNETTKHVVYSDNKLRTWRDEPMTSNKILSAWLSYVSDVALGMAKYCELSVVQ